ncbi:amidohydrolase [Clostridium massiliodielmoense]|uniref:amidohydrolase n=1 Tax=Clostridium massiliodielmoense TaxID=1776385 RepID=UPI0001667CEF|nr:amidohydrolase [Clostridium massiliodielmoense]EDS76822.1 chlorohydrolase family protein [Clostridium botulinum C str. Eklund]KEH98171.1 N-ethylammeline chlorohydrolase [Clostridium botulinum C/D str. BKT12695]NEZ48361.1 amidohydrolase [Clostridium botulinum]
MEKILIKNVSIVTMNDNKEFISNGYILIEDNKIKEISEEDFSGETNKIKVIDGNGYCAMPGLINGHTHAAMTLLRGYGEGLPLMKWLNEKVWPMESTFEDKHREIGNKLAYIEMLRSGTTTFNDMYFKFDKMLDKINEFNIRCVLGTSLLGDSWEKQLKEAIDLKKLVDKNYKSGLMRTMIAPHSPYTLSREALVETARVAKEYKENIHIHLSETLDEVNIIKEKYNMTPVEYMIDTGIFENKVMAAHCVHLTDEDIEIIKDKNVSTVYNPQSNMKLASGIPRIIDMVDKKINVCIGTDGTCSNNNLNMFEEMETGALLQNLFYNDTTRLSSKSIVKMATINGAKALGIDKLGSIEIGNIADIIMINMNKPTMIPCHDIYSNIVFSANGSEVEYVIIDGKIIMEKGEFINIDEEKILYESKVFCEKL